MKIEVEIAIQSITIEPYGSRPGCSAVVKYTAMGRLMEARVTISKDLLESIINAANRDIVTATMAKQYTIAKEMSLDD